MLIDFHEMHLDEHDYRWVLLLIDSFSKFIWGKALKTKETIHVANFILETFYVIGIPTMLQHDNGGEFVSDVVQYVLEQLKVRLKNFMY